jgi:hypothetical protein
MIKPAAKAAGLFLCREPSLLERVGKEKVLSE